MVNNDNLVQELKKHNIQALDFLVDNYSSLVFKIAYSVLHNRELSEECVNDVFLKVWNGIKSFKSSDDRFKKWIMVTAKYTAIDTLRKEVKHGKNISLDNLVVENIQDSKQEYVSFETNDLLIGGINKMDKTSKEIFMRRFFIGEKIKDIGTSMGISEASISNRLLRGKKKLQLMFKGGEV